jgi:hypothetical protein
MKRIVSILILSICAFCASGCNVSTTSLKNGQLCDCLSQKELEQIQKYAEQLRFEELREPLHELAVHPQKASLPVSEAIKHAAETGEKRHLPYAALFALRLYRKQKELYRQGYSLNNLCQGKYKERYYLACEFIRLAKLKGPGVKYVTTFDCYNWIQKNKPQFRNYLLIIQELSKIDRLQEELECQWHQDAAKTNSAQLEDLIKVKRFAMEAPVVPNGFAPAPVPEEINYILKRFQEQGRADHLPYLLEYGLNLYLKNLILTRLARVLPVNENLMLSELVRLAKLPKYKTYHEAGWLDSQFHKSGDITERPYGETGYSSYQIYIWYLENWRSIRDMPNIERLCDIQNQIEKAGMHGVGGGKVCHYGCR